MTDLVIVPPDDARPLVAAVEHSDNTVTITLTMPASLADGHEVNLTLTPRSQRIAPLHTPREDGAPTPVNTPRRPPPRFELGTDIRRSHSNRARVGDDPFANNGVTPSSSNNAPAGTNRVVPAVGTGNNIRIVDVDSDSDEDVDNLRLPTPIHPTGQNATPNLPLFATRPYRYFVVTKGRKVGVFYDTWCVL